ncbi:hypothetical protein [Spiroplasma endosymbiont of Aspidapion aeneum]|uniref:hypothetical protein n=1 Tax=Spiroplasma endosymbiont of Aspidapion aeneum TaxID=3066276 RepID=UPI00313BAA33
MYFSHEDNKNLVDIANYYYKSNIDKSYKENMKIKVEDSKYDSHILLDNMDNIINFPIKEKYFLKVINYDPENLNYQIKSDNISVVDCYFDVKNGVIILYGVSLGNANLDFEAFDKKDGYFYNKKIAIKIVENNQSQTKPEDYDPSLYKNYLDKLISGFEFEDEQYDDGFNFEDVENNINFGSDGITYKHGWKLNYDRHTPESIRKYYKIPQSFLIKQEFEIDEYSTKNQSVIDPFIIEDLRNNLKGDKFSEKYLLKPKIVKIKKVYVDSEEEKIRLLSELKDTLGENDPNNKYVRRITGLRYKELLNEISRKQEKVINTYGSVMFEKIAESIKSDLKIYQNNNEENK